MKHRSAQAQSDLAVIPARAGLVRTRTSLVNTLRGLAKSYGERLPWLQRAQSESGESGRAKSGTETVAGGDRRAEPTNLPVNERIEALARQSYPQVALLKQIKGVGTVIPLTFVLRPEDPHCFGKSRDFGDCSIAEGKVAQIALAKPN